MRITLSTGIAAELARPTSGDAVGGLVLWADVFDIRPLFDEMAQRLADAHQWVVVCPELFPGEQHLDVAERLERTAMFVDADKVADAEAAADATGFDRVGVMGFCMGGMWAMKSLASERFERAASFYGMVRLPERWADGTMGDAIDTVRSRDAQGQLKLLAIFGTDDPWCPQSDIDELRTTTSAEVVVYEGAGHGWAQDPARDNYRPEDAADAFTRAEAFLDPV
ncbi:MAG: dienelactone hydrolase family protein [Microthrixaceae bacterium]|nr:dienelactone hydrolase family protein [Microthrixaceae bacterium]MCO5312072.1 dienelactone hydrolase family protein [Microthrixaceae bacterium]TXI55284.1 MAG: hypothetical protein E6Q57_01170 [Mycobacterium sp.]HPB44910.1 dienelactone hydrolase family protein [Microthrixaceae bacterium]